MISVALACLPTAVSLLLLEALFMQISGMSLTHTWPCRLCLLRVLLCTSLCYKLSPFQAHAGGETAPAFSGLHVCLQLMWEVGLPPSPVEFSSHRHFYKFFHSWLLGVLLLLPAGMFVYSSHGKWVFSPLLWSFPPSITLISFPTPGWWVRAPALTRASLAWPNLFIYSSRKDSVPPSSALSAPHPLSHMSLFFLLLITQFLFYPQVEVGLSRGLCWSGPELSVWVLWYC
jgi:hypothetical protein